jgi:outer membrane protein OmpA-like peptidoglycan-associated protein
MKKVLLMSFAALFMISANAQKEKKEKHVSAGITGAFNIAQFKVKPRGTPTSLDYQFHRDGMGGFWVNIPLSSRFSFEPQILFISNRMKPANGTPTDFDGRINYVGLPLLLKIHAGKFLAFPVGVQYDIRTSVNDFNDLWQKEDFQNYSFGVTAGIEILPNARVSIFGRYVYGLTSVNNLGDSHRPYDLNIMNIYAGLKIRLFDFEKKKVIPPPPPPPPPPPGDRDGDGILDDVDKCPDVKGLPRYQGCPIPDTDKDGINDEEDKCPTVPGLPRYQGCPIPDTDGDGINDEQDKCPTVPGLLRYNGCPIPDTDGDGVNDEEDRCVTIPGPKENYGCPIIPPEVKKRVDIAAKNILFVTGSYKLQSSSFKGLNDVVKIMQDNPGMLLAIDGHTDWVGTDEYNQKLSDNRAAAVKAYIVSKGIDESRISSAGHGESMPIADNKTSAGRQKNRRSEMTLSYYK